MNALDMMTTLVDAARQLPENKHLSAAIVQAEKRIEVLRERYQRRGYGQWKGRRADLLEARDLSRIAQANGERFIAAGRCPTCGYFSSQCQCWDPVNHI